MKCPGESICERTKEAFVIEETFENVQTWQGAVKIGLIVDAGFDAHSPRFLLPQIQENEHGPKFETELITCQERKREKH